MRRKNWTMGTVHRVAQLSSEKLRRNLTHVQSHEVLSIMGIQVRIFSSLILIIF
jgi:hypothetical protein